MGAIRYHLPSGRDRRILEMLAVHVNIQETSKFNISLCYVSNDQSWNITEMYDYAIINLFQGNECSIGVFSCVTFPKWKQHATADHIYVKSYDILALNLVSVHINAYIMYYL